MPKLWTETVDAHRAAVRDAILDCTATLVAEHGPSSVTMSQIAKETGIGRATLYKYFPDVESILTSWHERQIADHLEQLEQIARTDADVMDRLEAVLRTYALIQHRSRKHRHGDLAAVLHGGEHVARAEQNLHRFIRDLLAEGARADLLRSDVSPAELATYCLHALTAAGRVSSQAAVHRLVTVTISALVAQT